MRNDKKMSTHCAVCGAELPRGVRVALFATPESEAPVLGDFCSVAHAFSALDEAAQTTSLPDTLVLGVRVDREGHDEAALASVMAEMVRRAVRAALEDDTLSPASSPAPRTSAHQLN